VANLKGSEDKYDALVFACGDAIPQFAANVGKSYNQDMLAVMAAFAGAGKLMAGHCGFAVLIDGIPALKGKRVALHPYVKNAVKSVVATDEKQVVDGNIYSAQTENTLSLLIPELLKALK
jgi:putative intracellular protease/amidase